MVNVPDFKQGDHLHWTNCGLYEEEGCLYVVAFVGSGYCLVDIERGVYYHNPVGTMLELKEIIRKNSHEMVKVSVDFYVRD